jgi:hypothetical protein
VCHVAQRSARILERRDDLVQDVPRLRILTPRRRQHRKLSSPGTTPVASTARNIPQVLPRSCDTFSRIAPVRASYGRAHARQINSDSFGQSAAPRAQWPSLPAPSRRPPLVVGAYVGHRTPVCARCAGGWGCTVMAAAAAHAGSPPGRTAVRLHPRSRHKPPPGHHSVLASPSPRQPWRCPPRARQRPRVRRRPTGRSADTTPRVAQLRITAAPSPRSTWPDRGRGQRTPTTWRVAAKARSELASAAATGGLAPDPGCE